MSETDVPFPKPTLFKALADPNRLKILETLCGCSDPQSVSDVSGCCDIDFSVLSRHLAQLRDAGAVDAKKEGRHVRYTAKAAELAKLFRSLADALEECPCCDCSCDSADSAPKPKTKGKTNE